MQSNCSYCGKLYEKYMKKQKHCSRYCYVRNYYIENKSTINAHNKKWHENNKERMNEFGRKHRRKRKVGILEHYGGIYCSICGVDDIEVLTLDHIAGGGTKERRKFKDGHATYRWIINNNYPDGFRVLCRNCNWKEYLKTVRGE